MLQPILLSATANNWRLFMMRKADPAFLTFQQKVFERDSYTCQFCNFQAKSFQEVINLDGNYLNNRLSNLTTACGFCAQCFFLEAIGKSDFGGGTLIYLPEMQQNELNALCHVLFTSMIVGDAHTVEAKNIYRSLKLRSQAVEQSMGGGFSNPAMLGQMMIEAKRDNLADLQQELSNHVRVLPNITRFFKEVRTWAYEALKELAIGKK